MSTVYAINPAKKRRTKRAAPKQRRKSKKRPSAAQLRARAKFVAMVRAKAKTTRAAKAASHSTRRAKPVAAKRKRRKVRRTGAAMKSVHRKGGGAVSRSAWQSSGYRRNRPKRRRAVGAVRRRRRGGYRRNPSVKGIFSQALGTMKDSGLVLAGSALGNLADQKLPGDSSNPVIGLAKGLATGILIRMFAARFIGADNARLLAAGAVAPAVKNAAIHYVPGAAPFLGEGVMSLPPFPGSVDAYPQIGSYSQGMSSYSAM